MADQKAKIMQELFPGGIMLGTAEAHGRFQQVQKMVSNLVDYCDGFYGLSDLDESLVNLEANSQILRNLDKEERDWQSLEDPLAEMPPSFYPENSVPLEADLFQKVCAAAITPDKIAAGEYIPRGGLYLGEKGPEFIVTKRDIPRAPTFAEFANGLPEKGADQPKLFPKEDGYEHQINTQGEL